MHIKQTKTPITLSDRQLKGLRELRWLKQPIVLHETEGLQVNGWARASIICAAASVIGFVQWYYLEETCAVLGIPKPVCQFLKFSGTIGLALLPLAGIFCNKCAIDLVDRDLLAIKGCELSKILNLFFWLQVIFGVPLMPIVYIFWR